MKKLIILISLTLMACGSQDAPVKPMDFTVNASYLNDPVQSDRLKAQNLLESAYEALLTCDAFYLQEMNYYNNLKNIRAGIRVTFNDSGNSENCVDSFGNLILMDLKCANKKDVIWNYLYMTSPDPHENANGYSNVNKVLQMCNF